MRQFPRSLNSAFAISWAAYLSVALFVDRTIAQEPTQPINDPDRFAWELFTEINAETPSTGGKVLWETWALAREVFANPNTPPTWPESGTEPRSLEDAEPLLQQLIARSNRTPDDLRPLFDPSRPAINETRMNKAAFDFVVGHDLYYVEGQEAAFAEGEPIEFPVEAREIKARWEPIDAAQAARYHTSQVVDPDTGTVQVWGLKSLHITTKDLPNWFWATFEHVDNPARERVIASRDRHGLPTTLQGTKWENYVLRGTQTDFVDSTGVPTLLANSIIEEGFEASSSCISCHARATIGPAVEGQNSNRLPVFLRFRPVVTGPIGAPDPEWYWDLPVDQRRYLQTDFVWSMFRARRRGSPTPTSSQIAMPAAAAVNDREPIRANTSPGFVELFDQSADGVFELGGGDHSMRIFRPFLQSLHDAEAPIGGTRPDSQELLIQVDARRMSEAEFREFVEGVGSSARVDAASRMVQVDAAASREVLETLFRNPALDLFESSMPHIPSLPTLVQPLNRDARDTHQVDEAFDSYGLTGEGVSACVWDGGKVRATHQEFIVTMDGVSSSRIHQLDGATSFSEHATHVTGTIAAAGVVADARGMAGAANVSTHDWFDDTTEMRARAQEGAVVSNHSYGYPLGWEWNEKEARWEWWGAANATTDYRFGKYSAQSRAFDLVAVEHPTLSIFVAAGNDRNNNPAPGVQHLIVQTGQISSKTRDGDGQCAGGYDTLGGLGVAKNVITIGAINDILTDPPQPGQVVPTKFTSWGACDDGRIKPDVVANGFRLFSTSSAGDSQYANMSGTSMAAPTAAGIGTLLVECFRQHGVPHPRSDQMKVAVVHTAMSPTDGPSYQIGWGSLRADLAADLIAGTGGTFTAASVGSSTKKWKGQATDDQPIRVTIAWIDPAGASNLGGANDRTAALVNDLSLHLVAPDGTKRFPWSLNPAAPSDAATATGVNSVDNIERVDVAAPVAGEWRVVVEWPAAGNALHPFAIAISGMTGVTAE